VNCCPKIHFTSSRSRHSEVSSHPLDLNQPLFNFPVYDFDSVSGLQNDTIASSLHRPGDPYHILKMLQALFCYTPRLLNSADTRCGHWYAGQPIYPQTGSTPFR